MNAPLNINPIILGTLKASTPLEDKSEEGNDSTASVPTDNDPVNDTPPEMVSKPSLYERIKAAVSDMFSVFVGGKIRINSI